MEYVGVEWVYGCEVGIYGGVGCGGTGGSRCIGMT